MEQWEAFSSIWKSLAPDSMAHILGNRNQPPDVFTHIKGGKNEGIIGVEEHSSIPLGAQISKKPPTHDVERFLSLLRFDSREKMNALERF